MKKTARLAGFLYLLASIITLPGFLYVPGKLFVRGDVAATANNLRASDALLRLGIASELFSSVVFIFLVFVLYRLFEAVSNKQTGLMATLILLSLSILTTAGELPISFWLLIWGVKRKDAASTPVDIRT